MCAHRLIGSRHNCSKAVDPCSRSAQERVLLIIAEGTDDVTVCINDRTVRTVERVDRPVSAKHASVRAEGLDGAFDPRTDARCSPAVVCHSQSRNLTNYILRRGQRTHCIAPASKVFARALHRHSSVCEHDRSLGELPRQSVGCRHVLQRRLEFVKQATICQGGEALPELFVLEQALSAEHPNTTEVFEPDVSIQGLGYVTTAEIAMSDNGVRIAIMVRNSLQPRSFLNWPGMAKSSLNMNRLRNTTALYVFKVMFNQVIPFYRVVVSQNSLFHGIRLTEKRIRQMVKVPEMNMSVDHGRNTTFLPVLRSISRSIDGRQGNYDVRCHLCCCYFG